MVPGGGLAGAKVALPNSLAYFRALRPLKRMVPSQRDDAIVLDEDATAEQAMETGQWWPITRSRAERQTDITVVIDNSSSMVLWRTRVAEFISLLERVGAFRSIQVRLLDTVENADGSRSPLLRGGTVGAPPRDPDELLDPSGRRAVLLLTDGIGETWRPDVLPPVLAGWARNLPVTVVHLLPQWLWRRCGLEMHRARLSVPTALRPNRRWRYDLPDRWLEPDPDAVPGDAIPVPVIELQPRWLAWWARLMAGEQRGPTDSTVLLTTPNPGTFVPSGLARPDAHQRVNDFRRFATPPSQRLATLLAAVPVQLDVAHVIRQHFVPEAGPEHLSELLLSGVLHPPVRETEESTWDTSVLTFPAEVRELLLSGGRRSETAGVVRVAAAHFGEAIPVLGHLRDAISDPDNTADPALTRENSADVALESAVMRALSGPYLSRADRLRNAIPHDVAVPTTSESIQTVETASDDMPETAERADRPQNTTAEAAPATNVDIDVTRPAETEQEPVTTPLAYPPSAWNTRTFARRQPDEPPPVWGNVPPRNPNFTGRVELLDQLGKRLTAGGTTAVLPSALHGMGGIGKTQMATEYIYRHLQDYDLIWWVEAAHPTRIRAGFTELARQLGLPGGSEANTAVPAVREALRTGRPFRRWLLVFDAAESPDAVRPFFPANGPGEILITSRNPDWAGVARPLELAVFKRDESIELLGKRGPEIDPVEANLLAERLGDLPLAIEQAAAWRAVTGMPVSEYLRLFDESVAEILDTSTPSDYEVSVAAAWNVSFDELKTRNPAAHQILHICAFFSPEPISRDLFTGGASKVSISEELDAALRDPIKLARAIRDINRYGLAKIDHGNNTLQLHRLVQLVLRNRVMGPKVHAQMRHGAHQLLASLDPNDPESSRNWARYREILPHAYAADVVDCSDSWPRQLVINLMRFLFQWGDHEEAANLAMRAHRDFTEKLGPTHEQTLDVAMRLGFYLWGLGRYDEAAQLNQRTLELRLEVSGAEGEETLAVQANIVTDHRAKGDFAAAAVLSGDIYHKSRRLFGEDDPETLNAAYQHALSLRLSGDYQEAEALDEDTYKRRVEVLGPDHPRTFTTNVALIIDRREAGEYIQARIEQEKVTEAFRLRFSEDSPGYAAYAFQLSVARRKHGDHTGSLKLSTEAYQQCKRSYGATHPTTMACSLAHSIDLRHSGDLDQAKALGEDTFDRYRDILGEEHPHTFAATVDLAVTMRLRGEVAEARALDERALEHFRATIGPDHPYAIIATINLASDLAALGETDQAIVLNRDALERGTRVMGGRDHPTMLAAAFNLGLDLTAAGHAEEAAEYHEPTLARYRKVLGEGHPGTRAAGRGTRADCDIDPMLL